MLNSNKVDIWCDIEVVGAGLVADDMLAGRVSNFKRWLAMNQTEFHAMKARTTSVLLITLMCSVW